jgi:hypothetical protein
MLVFHPTLINQHLGWQQLITPLIVRQPRVVSYPPYPMWYYTIPSFVPMDPNMYSMNYCRIKGPNSLIFGRKERHATGTTQIELMPHVGTNLVSWVKAHYGDLLWGTFGSNIIVHII